jgi:hypothetical protein
MASSRLRLSLLLASLSEHASCCHVQPSILLFISKGRVSHLTPSLLSGWLLTNVQVNNITTLHDTHGHMYIHHIGITILLPFYTSSTLLCRLAGTDHSRLIQSLTCILCSPLVEGCSFHFPAVAGLTLFFTGWDSEVFNTCTSLSFNFVRYCKMLTICRGFFH